MGIATSRIARPGLASRDGSKGTDTIRAEIHGNAAWPEPPRVPMKL